MTREWYICTNDKKKKLADYINEEAFILECVLSHMNKTKVQLDGLLEIKEAIDNMQDRNY